MNINFKTHFPWPGADGAPEPTHFAQQIMNELVLRDGAPRAERPYKLHTIRRVKDKPRFREGMRLVLQTGSRFKPMPFVETECTGVQQVSMRYNTGPKGDTVWLEVDIDGKACSDGMLRRLAQNDGFARTSHFTRWFLLDVLLNGPGEYQLVHWTEVRY